MVRGTRGGALRIWRGQDRPAFFLSPWRLKSKDPIKRSRIDAPKTRTQVHLKRDQLKKTVGMRMQLQPVAHRLDDAGYILPQIDDDWIVESVAEDAVKISNPRTGLFTSLGFDHIYSYTSNPGRVEGGAKFGFLMLKVQLTLKRHEIIVRPTLRPGEPVPPPPQIEPPESATDRLARLAAEKHFAQQTEFLGTTAEALHAVQANREMILVKVSESVLAHASNSVGSLQGEAGFGSGAYGANLGPIGCLINYHQSFGNVTSGIMTVRFFRNRIAVPGTNQVNWGDPGEIAKHRATVTRSPSLGWCWLLQGQSQPQFSEQIADFVIDEFTRLNR